MALHFLSPDAATASAGSVVVLTGQEAHHASAVRRVRAGETVTVGDGHGVWLEGTCESATAREVTVRVAARREVPPLTPRLVLAQALAKGDRDELAVQAATELGVDAVVPWQAERSVSRWDGKAAKGVARWETIVREASKQAHRAWVPAVEALSSTADLSARPGPGVRMLVLEPTAEERLSETDLTGAGSIILVVGPEGGIAQGELAALEAAGARIVRLGETVLRTSTAGAAALSVVNVRLGRW